MNFLAFNEAWNTTCEEWVLIFHWSCWLIYDRRVLFIFVFVFVNLLFEQLDSSNSLNFCVFRCRFPRIICWDFVHWWYVSWFSVKIILSVRVNILYQMISWIWELIQRIHHNSQNGFLFQKYAKVFKVFIHKILINMMSSFIKIEANVKFKDLFIYSSSKRGCLSKIIFNRIQWNSTNQPERNINIGVWFQLASFIHSVVFLLKL